MILRLSIFLFCVSIFTVKSQPAAKGGASLNQLLGQTTTGPTNANKTKGGASLNQLLGQTTTGPTNANKAQGGASLNQLLGQTTTGPTNANKVQGGASLNQLLGQTTTGPTNANDQATLEQKINKIFKTGSPDASESTTAPDRQPSKSGVPGTESCTCVPYYLCNNGTINKNGVGIIDIRINDGPCETYIEVCCNKEDQAETPITAPPPRNKQTVCGFRHPDGVGFRITGDTENEAQFGEFPWMVAVLREEAVEGNFNKLNVYKCGGALIHPQAVVTAAHCVSGKNKGYKIRAGEWDTQHTQELLPHQDREVQNIVVHPEYYSGALYNDIAILYLKTPLDIAENVDTVCLPPQGTNSDTATCYATGWGKDVFDQKGKHPVILKKIDLPVVPNGECQSRLRTTRLGKFFELHKSFMCAGGVPGKDTCKGDGGSPLVCPIPGTRDRYYQVGIVAWGIGCGESNNPGVYVNLALFREWIDTQVKSFGLDTSTYQY